MIFSFDKFHVLDLGIIRQFCHLKNTVLSRTSSPPLSGLMGIANKRFSTLLPAARLSSHLPFQFTQHDIQAGITGKIRRHSVPFFWVSVMGFSHAAPPSDDDPWCSEHLDLMSSTMFYVNARTGQKNRYNRGNRICLNLGYTLHISSRWTCPQSSIV